MVPESVQLCIRGGYGYGNFGDDALMVAVHQVAARLCPAQETGYLCRPASYLRTLVPEARVLRLRDRDPLAVRLLLFGGGTQFYSFPPSGRQRGFVTRARRILREPRLLPRKVAQRLVPTRPKELPDHADTIAALGVGVGPFVTGSAGETQTRELFAKMRYVSVRDARSYELCRQWGVKNLHHHADLCFWPDFQAAHVSASMRENRRIRRLGLIVRDWPHSEEGDSYHQSLLAVADGLHRAGKAADFILFAGRHERIWLKRLKATKSHVVCWNPETDSIRTFVQRLASYDLFLTARYHGAIFATLLEKPAICIGVEPKLGLFADVLGAAGRCWKYPFDASECLRLIGEIDADYSGVTAQVRDTKRRQSTLACRMVDSFLAFARRQPLAVCQWDGTALPGDLRSAQERAVR
jgi:polysaccharide pyruvyl transferase WcaK-like protein